MSDLRAAFAARLLLAAVAVGLAACGTATAPAPAGSPPPAPPSAPPSDAAAAPAAAPLPFPAPATILWDEWGIPHVRAADEAALFYAYGWAQARNHGELLVESFGRARARGAEVWGEEALEDDVWYRTVGLPEWTRRSYAALEPAMRQAVDRFAAGVNAYLGEHPEALSPATAAVLPVSGEDVMANLGAIRLRFSSARADAERWRRRGGGNAALAAPAERAVASNAWALGPAKSASGNALLLANPHLPWGGNLTWFEAHLTAPGIDVYGASLVGMPVIAIGFNRRLAWTHTVNTQDTEDLYRLDLAEGGYRFAGGIRPFERRAETIRVRTGDGFRDEEVEVLSSVHGPVLARAGEEALALRRVDDVVAGLGAALGQWWAMGRAEDFDDFAAALATHAIAGQNITYADAGGRIAYFYGGVLPRRPRGDSGFWAGLVAGDDPELVWGAAHSFADMPRVIDPASGWLQNANDPPWISTFPPALDADAFPAYFGPRELPLRPQQSIELLRDSGVVTLEEMVALKHSTEVELAERVLPDLLAAAEAAEATEPPAASVRRAAEVLAAWDRATDADSRGAVLFAAWVREMTGRAGTGFFARPWDEAAPLATPAGLADPATARDALAAAAAAVQEAHGRLDVAWGEVNRLRVGDHDLPGNGGPGGLGVFRVTHFAGGDETTDVAVGGDSFVAAVELAAGGPRALALLSYGNASQPGSRHRGDQLPLYAEQRLRPVHFETADVEAAAVERTELRGAATAAAEPTAARAAAPTPAAEAPRWTWTGFEIVGQRRHTREQIAALLPVELGTPYPQDRSIFERCNEILRAELDVAHVACSNVLFSTGEAYLVVEVVEHGEEERREYRPAPAGDAPLAPELAALYDRFHASWMAAFREGTDIGENLDAGYLDYRHPELHALVEEMRRVVPPRREEVLRVLAENPEGASRARAAWLLDWLGDEVDTIARVVPSLDDPHAVTRNNLTRFLLHHVDRIQDEATLRALVDALARQLSRPSHGDRNKAVYSLEAVLEAHPALAPYVLERAGPWLRRIAEQSILDNVGDVAREVLATAEGPPAPAAD